MQETSPLEALERAVLAIRDNREELEENLQRVPRWRFRRRRAVERSVRRRRDREQRLLEELSETPSEAVESPTR